MTYSHDHTIQDTNKTNNAKNYEKFYDILWANITEEERILSDISQDKIERVFFDSWNLLKNIGNEKYTITVSKIDNNLAVLQVISVDTPFIVDSIMNEIRLNRLQMKLIVQPVLTVQHNNKDIVSINDTGSNYAITQIYFNNLQDDDLVSLQEKMRYVMECVHHVFHDWRTICDLAKSAANNIVSYIENVEKNRNENINNNLKIIDNSHINEIPEFINWLLNDNFLFLGSVIVSPIQQNQPQNSKQEALHNNREENKKFTFLQNTTLGLLHNIHYNPQNILDNDSLNITIDNDGSISQTILFKKTKLSSVVHRSSHMEAIYIPQFDVNKEFTHYIVLIGFFTSAVYSQNIINIPIIRDKISEVLKLYNHSLSGYNVKEMITALQSYPRTELLQMSINEIYDLGTTLVSLTLIPRIKVFVRHEENSDFLSILLFVPKNRFSTDIHEQIEQIICDQLKAVVSKRYIQITDLPLVRSQLILKLSNKENINLNINVNCLEKAIISLVHRWEDNLFDGLISHFSTDEAQQKFHQFRHAFNDKYTFNFTAENAVYDMPFIEKAHIAKQYDISITNDQLWQIKIYHKEEMSISSIMPSLQNLGLNVLTMTTYEVSPFRNEKTLESEKVYIHLLQIKPQKYLAFSVTLKEHIEDTLYQIDQELIDDDILNSLVLYGQMSYNEVLIIRTYAKYLKQIMFPYGFHTIAQAMLNNSSITKQLVWVFYAKFGSVHCLSEDELTTLQQSVLQEINNVTSLIEDQILRIYLELINATKRTNYFLNDGKKYISIKISSKEINSMPLPKPFREIFVYSNRFEAIHLRGGKIARGGIRWSDRLEDFRTEVLGLMKTQMTKNSVIIPVGSKGGFVLKKNINKENLLQEGIDCYRLFLSGVLDLTDNINSSADVIHPNGILCYDDFDPYLVVAADKGTATFSDYANEISEQYKFWLDDAFASGGSAGYDHKKMAITAKGAWISILHHLHTLDITPEKQQITLVGIGDMSGDVFGNGLLSSENMKLIAAFNHAHIFIDPNPDIKKSYKERLRLFNLPRSQWTDYDQSLISSGGGIFPRTLKNILITSEMQIALGINNKVTAMTPNELIRSILMAPVDVLWNGGIGTYVKATEESNEMIGDKANDLVRINGNELRCKAVGEGGNLGFTQKGRIEYANSGGLINTDFIDNSGGVDCSDHEVNIKIAFSSMINAGLLSKEQRNDLLVQMTSEIADLVLRDNLVQNQLISLEFSKGSLRLNDHIWLINHLEKRGELDRKVENLPNSEELQKLMIAEKSLSRPAIAVLIAYAKNSAIALIDGINLHEDDYMSQILLNYFPQSMRDNSAFIPYIKKHKLANEIIATMVVNDFINTMGCSFFHQLLDSDLSQPIEILKAFLLTKHGLGIEDYLLKIEKSNMSYRDKLNLFVTMQRFISRNMLMLLQHGHTSQNLALDISNYSAMIANLKQITEQITITDNKPWHSAVIKHGFPELIHLYYAMDIIEIANKGGSSLEDIANSYYWLRKYLRINDILHHIEEEAMVSRMDYISQMAFISIINTIDGLLMKLALTLVQSPKLNEEQYMENIISHCDYNQITRYNKFIDSLHSSIRFESAVSTLVLVKKHLQNIMHSCFKTN